jgi:carboxyl-terminal processing protease
LQSGELSDSDKIEVADSLKFTTPKGKIVYGGGGIIPDVFVPVDTAMENETLTYLKRRGVIGYFVFETLEKNRAIFEVYKRQDFIDDFEVTDDLVIEFQDYLNVRIGSKVTFVAYNEEVKQYIKAVLADQLFGEGALQEVLNQSDIMLEEVLALRNDEL